MGKASFLLRSGKVGGSQGKSWKVRETWNGQGKNSIFVL